MNKKNDAARQLYYNFLLSKYINTSSSSTTKLPYLSEECNENNSNIFYAKNDTTKESID